MSRGSEFESVLCSTTTMLGDFVGYWGKGGRIVAGAGIGMESGRLLESQLSDCNHIDLVSRTAP
jgi:hypothetical protein